MSEPNFDFNTTCVTLTTCLFNIKNWLLTTPNTIPLTIYLEPTKYTYPLTTGSTTFATALNDSTQTGGPTAYAPTQPPVFQQIKQENNASNAFQCEKLSG